MTVAQAIARSAQCGTRLNTCFRVDSRLLLRAIFWRTVLPLLKRAVPLPTLVRWMAPNPAAPARHDASARLDTLRHFVAYGGRLVVSENCLERSLMLYRFLAEAHASPTLVMGVKRDDGVTDGHVWIDVDGEPLADSTTSRFTPILVFGADGAALHAQCETV